MGISEEGPMSETERSYYEDLNTTRLFVMPTGQTLGKGKSYFADYELFLLWYSYGMTDNLMISLGATLLPLPLDWVVFYLGPKVKLWDSGKGQSVSVGAHIIIPPLASWGYGVDMLGAAYVAMTSENRAISTTMGGGALVFPETYPGLFAGVRAGPGRVKFLAEYWHVLHWRESSYYGNGLEQWPCLVIGCRFTGRNLSADLGLIYYNLPEWITYSPIGIPLVNFVYNF